VAVKSTGVLVPIPELQALVGLVGHPTDYIDLYAYAGLEQASQTSFTVNGTLPFGYGNPLYNNTACLHEAVSAAAAASLILCSFSFQTSREAAATKPFRDDVSLRRLGAAGRRLRVAQFGEDLLQLREERALCAALEHLGYKGAAGSEDLPGDNECRLGEGDDPQMVGRGMPRRRGRHVAQHDIGQIAELGPDGSHRGGIINIGV